jgi:hypothetical protein
MSEILAAIASAVGTALVAAAATDLWGSTRAQISRLLGRDEPERQGQIDGWLDATAAQADRTGPDSHDALERQAQAWVVRLTDHLERHPDTAAELRDLLARLRAALPAVEAAVIRVSATGAVDQRAISGGAVANTGMIMGDVTINRRPQ